MEIDEKRYLELSLPQRRKDVEKEFSWFLAAASAYARSETDLAFRSAKHMIGKDDRFLNPISKEDVLLQKKAFTEAMDAFFDEVLALRKITERHGEPQTDGTVHTD